MKSTPLTTLLFSIPILLAGPMPAAFSADINSLTVRRDQLQVAVETLKRQKKEYEDRLALMSGQFVEQKAPAAGGENLVNSKMPLQGQAMPDPSQVRLTELQKSLEESHKALQAYGDVNQRLSGELKGKAAALEEAARQLQEKTEELNIITAQKAPPAPGRNAVTDQELSRLLARQLKQKTDEFNALQKEADQLKITLAAKEEAIAEKESDSLALLQAASVKSGPRLGRKI